MCIQLVCKGIFFSKPLFGAVGVAPSQFLSYLLRPICSKTHYGSPLDSLSPYHCISGSLPGPKHMITKNCGPCLVTFGSRVTRSWNPRPLDHEFHMDPDPFTLLRHFAASWEQLVMRYPVIYALSYWAATFENPIGRNKPEEYGRAQMVLAYVAPCASVHR